MDRAREQFLAGACLAEQQHRAPRRNDLLHPPKRVAQREAVADDLAERRTRAAAVVVALVIEPPWSRRFVCVVCLVKLGFREQALRLGHTAVAVLPMQSEADDLRKQ